MAQTTNSNPADAPSEQDAQRMLGQAVLTGLVALLLLVFSFSYFIWKQNRELGDLLIQGTNQSKSAQNIDNFFNSFVYDLSLYSQQHPEVLQIMAQSGFDVSQQPRAPAPAPAAAAPRGGMPPLPAPPSGQ
jgi:hypothetical protein